MRLRREFLQRCAVRVNHDAQKLRFRANPHCGKRCIPRGNIDRRHFIRTESDGWCWLNVVAEAHFPRDLHHPAVADEFRDFDGRDVEGIRQGVAHRDAPHEFFSIVIRSIFLAVKLECRWLVVDCRGGRDDGLHAVNSVIQCRRINKRFEHRSRLAMRQRMIQLALPVIAPANDRLDFSGPRVQRDQRDLCLRDRLATSLLGLIAPPLVVFFCQEQIHILHPRIDSGGRCTLQSGIERRVNTEILAQQFVLGVFVEQVVFHHVDEVGRFTP